jgi:hypothetical protein
MHKSTALVATALLWPFSSHAAEDPYACFGVMRYAASRAGYSCSDLDALCASARAIYIEAGRDRATANRLAKERGHGATTIRLANRWCKP